MRGAREFVADLLSSMGFAVEVVPTELHPIVLARRGGDPSWPHVIIYGHYDVQPADPAQSLADAAVRADRAQRRLYGRGAADNKGPLMVHISAVARLLERKSPGRCASLS
jgi:acetylornithine deacetylase/succinyl-diaminopimelate desuccinylase-like protein